MQLSFMCEIFTTPSSKSVTPCIKEKPEMVFFSYYNSLVSIFRFTYWYYFVFFESDIWLPKDCLLGCWRVSLIRCCTLSSSTWNSLWNLSRVWMSKFGQVHQWGSNKELSHCELTRYNFMPLSSDYPWRFRKNLVQIV